MIYVIVKLPCHEEGAAKLINWAKSDDGFSVTRSYKGFQHIELLVDENKKTIWLYEQWDTKEDHQAYLSFRMDNGFEDFVKEIVEEEFSLSYLTNAGIWLETEAGVDLESSEVASTVSKHRIWWYQKIDYKRIYLF